ncbi:DUF2785 domain-containing protein [Bacillus sp. KH172YL63]|uniref:DUF2785 domain-containing protein n=1 Tax=Bacillus sp. KH172YL63 TaxID=2709784 RepID=UPI0013E4C1E4|nr:DUF2785 domain-containing protein [Bacillus sp. KH172YL63]BCB03611.1 membrane protein [Bacillus sp. KH172YL63]
MITETQLKEKLREIDFTQFASIEGVDMDLLLGEMIFHIGSVDGQLRDNLIYSSFYRLIEHNALSSPQMLLLLDTCMDENHLFLGIGSRDDTVFTRAFSSLVLALLLRKNRTQSFLPPEKVHQAISACFHYLEREEDTRGYVEGKGWAHSIAHGADLLEQVIRHPAFSPALHVTALAVIENCLLKDTAYMDEEDGRLFYAIEALLDRGMEIDVLYRWLSGLKKEISERFIEQGYSNPFYRTKLNIENFYKTCYFRLKWRGTGEEICAFIEKLLEKWHNHDYN